MIKRYFEFINESLEFIIESDVIYSDKFKKVLNKIDHPLSKKILDIENKDLDVRNNFFDVSFDKNDKVSFIPDAKAQEILKKEENFFRFVGRSGGWLKHSQSNQNIFDKLGYTPDSETIETVDEETGEVVKVEKPKEPYNPNSMDVGKEISRTVSELSGKTYIYLQFENGKGVYNLEKLRPSDEGKNQVWSKNRQEIKVGKAIRALLKTANVDVNDKEIEEFVNSFKAALDRLNDKFSFFDVVSDDDISHFYNYKNYFENRGTLGSSCMARVPESFLSIYTENPDVCSLIIFRSQDDDSKIMGRALLWTLNNGNKFVDRIYTINDSDVQLFKDYAKENGWYVKKYNNSSDTDYVISPDGTEVRLPLKVTVRRGQYNNYPYLDTLKYYNPNSGILSVESGSSSYRLEDTDGHYLYTCEYCGGEGTVECGDCYGDGEVNCSNCDGRGQLDCNDCDGYGEINCSHCDGEGTMENDEGEEEDCSYCDGSGKEKCETCNGDGSIDCEDCSGDGKEECSNCRGSGTVDCYECS